MKSIFKKPVLSETDVLETEKYGIQVVCKPGETMFLAGHLNRSFLKETKEALVPDLQVNEIHLTYTYLCRRQYRTGNQSK